MSCRQLCAVLRLPHPPDRPGHAACLRAGEAQPLQPSASVVRHSPQCRLEVLAARVNDCESFCLPIGQHHTCLLSVVAVDGFLMSGKTSSTFLLSCPGKSHCVPSLFHRTRFFRQNTYVSNSQLNGDAGVKLTKQGGRQIPAPGGLPEQTRPKPEMPGG